jgi:acyl-Coa thioesterase superfamily protein/acyl-CoA thioesterase superfamily protein
MPHASVAGDHEFDRATALRTVADTGDFELDIHPQWTVGDKPNGGYLLALLGQAARQIVRQADRPWEVTSTTVTYLRAPELGPARISTTVLRHGRTASHVRAVLLQNDEALVDAVFVVGELHPSGTPRYSDIRLLQIPEPDDCFRIPSQLPGGTRVGIMECTELRMDPSVDLFGANRSAGHEPVAELRGWIRFADGREPDALSLLYFVDAIPPATFPIGSSGWVPTMQMAVYVRALPAPGWLGIRMEAHLVTDGTVDETCTLFDSAGHVVAQATQLARVRFPDPTP